MEVFVNIQERDIMKILLETPITNQRTLAEQSGHSLGVVNRSLKALAGEGYLDDAMRLTPKAEELRESTRPRRAIILAAGFGMRMVPINLETPKALLEVRGEPLIERQIRQLHEAGIREIYVVVGFMKEKFEYLIDEYGVKLVVNRDYAVKNNLHSLALVTKRLSDAYIIPCDIWCAHNPFSSHELYSWYMVSDREDPESDVRVNRRRELVAADRAAGERSAGNAMIGIAYLGEDVAKTVRTRISSLSARREYDGAFWEEALYEKRASRESGLTGTDPEPGKQTTPDCEPGRRTAPDRASSRRMIVPAKVIPAAEAVEINTYEQLRELDGGSNQLRSEVLEVIAKVFDCGTEEITDIEVLKKGMTNRSFLFSARGGKYIMRVPGEGTDKLINRRQEAEVYTAISGKGLCDDPVYLDPETGYKITKYLEGVRVCDAESEEDLRRCMAKLRSFHEMGLKVDHPFDIFGQIEFYESLWDGRPSVYRDYKKVKERVLSLRPFIEAHAGERVLTHIDAVPDNFLFYRGEDGTELLQLTDWEYAGMQDPHVDIAMFCIYSLYEKEQVDRLIGLYFAPERAAVPDNNDPLRAGADKYDPLRAVPDKNDPLRAVPDKNDPLRAVPDNSGPLRAVPADIVTKIYALIAACGLLWSNWCEYKLSLGVEFGEYSLRQYRYAKDYYKYAVERME